ncbi:MAG: hypothetical protein IIB60_00895 [Planctomycetes bacterium]|nr:hypothetical protein [Planctomycetota bacterium]
MPIMVADKNYGIVSQVIGSTLDAKFSEDQLPKIYNALNVELERTVLGETFKETLWCEVAQHLGGGRIRAIALGSTDGLQRGAKIVDTGQPVTVPVGEETLGRVFNLVGETIDGLGPVVTKTRMPIHRPPPAFDTLSSKTELFETGIKVIDLLCPLVRGGKTGLFGGAGVGKTVIIQELIARPGQRGDPGGVSRPDRRCLSRTGGQRTQLAHQRFLRVAQRFCDQRRIARRAPECDRGGGYLGGAVQRDRPASSRHPF